MKRLVNFLLLHRPAGPMGTVDFVYYKKNLLNNFLVNNIISLFRVDFKLTHRKNGLIIYIFVAKVYQ
jgi:hypothetical protein